MGMLQEKEQLVSEGSPLSFTGKNVTQDVVVTDISATEIKELVTGYSIIRASNIDDATAIARECPIFNYPNITVEVREIMQVG